MKRVACAMLLAIAAAPAAAFPGMGPRPAAPTEQVWYPAPTPAGGTPWSTLEATREVQRKDAAGTVYGKPDFTPAVAALAGKKIRVSGYMMPLQNGERQTHFVLLAYPPDCPYHLNPGPAQFIEVWTGSPVSFNYDVLTIEGTLQLTGQDESGIFYRIANGRAL